VEFLKREVAACNHDEELVERLVATRQDLQAAQLHSKLSAAEDHAQAAQLFEWVSSPCWARLACTCPPALFNLV
jgi:hypothetical protein